MPRQRPAEPLLRPARADDALCLSVLAMQVFLDTYATDGIRPALAREVLQGYSQASFAAALADPATRIVVAEIAEHLVGFAQLTLGARHALAPAGEPAELLRLYVQEPFTASGIGTRLLAHAEDMAAAAGATVLWLTPWVHNIRARAFYARRGYTDVGSTWFQFEGESHENRLVARTLPGFEFAPIASDADLTLLHGWLRRPHVAAWWGEAESIGDLRHDFIDEPGGTRGHIVHLNRRPLGFIQCYVVMGSGDGWWPDETDPGARGIDQFIAEPALLGQGVGSAMVRRFVDALFADPAVSVVQTDPRPDNARAIAAYRKAGFTPVGGVHTPDGLALLMRRRRDG
jgi:ribosomal protein S18 acetylase RimI-like enzyme